MKLTNALRELSEKSILVGATLHVLRYVLNRPFRLSNPLIFPSNVWHKSAKTIYQSIIPNSVTSIVDNYFLKKRIFFLVNNIPHSVGHCYGEIDYACRYLQINPHAKLIYLGTSHSILKTVKNLIPSDLQNRLLVLQSGLLNSLLYPLVLTFNKCLLDLSLGQHDQRTDEIMSYGDFWDVKYRLHIEYIKKTGLSKLRVPINNTKMFDKERLLRALEIDTGKKIAVIQIKDAAVNATFSATNPATLIPAINHLKSLNFEVVQAGRETTPQIYKTAGVKRFGDTTLASPTNDALLYSICDLAISSGSGVNNIPSKFNKPQLILNVWNFGFVGEISNLVWPTRLRRKCNDDLVSLVEQFEIIKNWSPNDSVGFYEKFRAVDADANDVMHALAELLRYIESGKWDQTIEKDNFYQMFNEQVFSTQPSQISNFFIQKNRAQ